MKIPNLASRNHSGTACFLSESQVGSKFEDCRELDSCPNPGTPAETSVAAIRELNLLRFMAILLIFQRELVIGQVRSQHADYRILLHRSDRLPGLRNRSICVALLSRQNRKLQGTSSLLRL